MKRLTTSNPDSNASQLLNYAYSEDGRVKLAYAGMKHNADLCEYISGEAGDAGLSCAPSPDDVMEGGCMECDCVFGVLNNVAIQAAELRARLMMIEDILGEDYDLEHLRELIKAERHWIRPEEQLPDVHKPVLVCREKEPGVLIVEQGCKDLGDWWRVYGTRVKRIRFWMPLPEPPGEV